MADGKYGKDSSDSDEKERLHGEYQTALCKTQVSPMILQLVEKESERLNQMELESLADRKTESEMQLEKKIETLEQELANKISEMNRSKEEKNNLMLEAQAQVNAEIDDIIAEFKAYSMELHKDLDDMKEILRPHGEGN